MNDIVALLTNNYWLFILLAAWSLIWKAIAAWRAARNNHLAWFIAIFVVNTIGLLEIIYLLFFSKKRYRY